MRSCCFTLTGGVGILLSMDKIEPNTVVEQAMEKIKDLIASGEYKANDRLPTQAELASRFDIGRNSIREAMRVFDYLGIVKSRTARGTVLCDREKINSEALTWSILLGSNNIFEMIQLRKLLEVEGLEICMDLYLSDRNSFDQHVADLEEIINRMERAVDNNSLEDLVASDFDFHAKIIAITGNSLFSEMFKTLKRFMNEETRQIDKRVDYNTACGHHKKILHSIKTGDKSQATVELKSHLQFVENSLKDILDS